MTAALLERARGLAQAGKQKEARELLVQVIAADVHDKRLGCYMQMRWLARQAR